MELDVIDEALDRLGGWDAAALADPELLVGLERVAARLEAVVARAAGAFDSSGQLGPRRGPDRPGLDHGQVPGPPGRGPTPGPEGTGAPSPGGDRLGLG